MPRNLQEVQDEAKAKRGTRQTFTEDDLIETTVFADTYRDILRNVSTESAKFYLGHGMRSRDDPNLGYMFADLQNDAAAEIDGTFRFIVYADSEDEVPIVGGQADSRDMRDAESEPRTERPGLPLLLPGAGKDKAIAVQFKARQASDGEEISAADSSVVIPYTQILE